MFNKKNNVLKFFSWLVVLIIFAVLAAFILIQKDVFMKNTIIIQELNREISELNEENKKIQIELSMYQKLEEIEKKATLELSMHYPESVVFLEEGE